MLKTTNFTNESDATQQPSQGPWTHPAESEEGSQDVGRLDEGHYSVSIVGGLFHASQEHCEADKDADTKNRTAKNKKDHEMVMTNPGIADKEDQYDKKTGCGHHGHGVEDARHEVHHPINVKCIQMQLMATIIPLC